MLLGIVSCRYFSHWPNQVRQTQHSQRAPETCVSICFQNSSSTPGSGHLSRKPSKMVPAYAHPIMLGTLKIIKNYSKLSAEVIVVLNFVVVLFCFFQNKTLSSNGVLLGILICEAVESGISPNGVKGGAWTSPHHGTGRVCVSRSVSAHVLCTRAQGNSQGT